MYTVGGILGLTGRTAASAGHKLAGTKEKASAKLNQREASSLGNIADPRQLKKIAGERKEALRADEKIEIDKRRFGMGASILGGAALGGALGHEVGGLHLEHNVTDHMSIGDHVGRVNINDADKLLGHFATKLHHNDFAGGHEPASVNKLYELLQTKNHSGFLHGEDNASIKLGLEGPGGSTVMQPGDTVSLDNGQIVLDRVGHPEMHHVLIDRAGHLHPVNQEQWHQAQVVHHEAPKAESAPQDSAQAHTETHTEATPAAATTSADAGPRDLNAAAPEPNYTPAGGLRAEQLHANLASEYQKAHEAYNAGLKTPEQQAAYNTYNEHLKEYHELVKSAPSAAPGPSSAEAAHTAPTHAEAPKVTQAPTIPESVTTLTHTPGWNDIKGYSATDVYDIPGDDPSSILMREYFLALVRESGIKPTADQDVEEYVQMATKAIQDRAH